MLFSVRVTRTVRQVKTIVVESDNGRDAQDKAVNEALSQDFGVEDYAEYTAARATAVPKSAELPAGNFKLVPVGA